MRLKHSIRASASFNLYLYLYVIIVVHAYNISKGVLEISFGIYYCTTATFSAMISVIICSASLKPVASSSAIISS